MDSFPASYRIIDISQPIQASTACFPGDIPFSRDITVSYQQSAVMNLTAFTMSPHIGTHADAPVHITGNLKASSQTIGNTPLAPFIGPACVVDVSPCHTAIHPDKVLKKLHQLPTLPERILFKTRQQVKPELFEADYAWFSPDLVNTLAEHGVRLLGLDTPSVDHVDSKTLGAHHALLQNDMVWLENLDLSQAPEGEYFLIALPLKLMELEASPVRAVLLAH